MSLTREALESRLLLDYRVVRAMAGDILQPEAYRTSRDLERRTSPITSDSHGHLATKFRAAFRVRTLIGPGQFADETVIGFDLGVRDYPYAEPATWLISKHVPYSPHFRAGYPVCIGEVWQEAKGTWLLGHLLRHVARLLNWDEVARSGGYVGWNGAAIRYHEQVYHGRPLDPDLRYPVLPLELTHNANVQRDEGLFAPTSRNASRLAPRNPSGLFMQVKGGR